MMDVYLVPVGPDRLELHCESAEDHAPLAEFAGLEHLPTDVRASRVRAIAAELELPRLAQFLERTAVEVA